MGSDSSIYILNKTKEDIFYFIKTFIDNYSSLESRSSFPEDIMQSIRLRYNTKDRSIRCYNHEINSDKYDNDYENNPQTVDSYSLIHDGLPDGIKGVWCILGANENAISLSTLLVSYFGGWIQKNDSKDKFEYKEQNYKVCVDKIFNSLL